MNLGVVLEIMCSSKEARRRESKQKEKGKNGKGIDGRKIIKLKRTECNNLG